MQNNYNLSDKLFSFDSRKLKQSIPLWINAWQLAESSIYPRKEPLLQCYEMAVIDTHLSTVIETRSAKVLGEPFVILNKDKVIDEEKKEFFKKKWFTDFIGFALESIAWGYTILEINFDSYTNGIIINSINRKNIVEKTKQVLINPYDTEGIDISAKNIRDFYIPIQSKYGLGLLNKAIFWTIFKRLSAGSHATFNEDFGLPMLLAKSDKDEDSKKQLMDTLVKLGKQRVAVIDTEEEMQVVFSSSTADGSKNFTSMIELCNQEISKLFLGDVKTTDNGGAQSYINIDVSNKSPLAERQEMDMEFIEGIINEQLLPRLNALGYDVEGLRFQYLQNRLQEEKSKKNAISDETLRILLDNYDLSPEWIKENLGVPVTNKVVNSLAMAKTETTNVQKPVNIIQSAENDEEQYLDNVFEKLQNDFENDLQSLYSDFEKNKSTIFQKIQQYNYKNLVNGLQINLDFETQDQKVLKSLRKNVFLFSGAKTYQITKELSALLVDNYTNTRRTFAQFKEKALLLNKDYNRSYLSAEYGLAITSSQTISQWQTLTKGNPKALITYSAVGDKRTTPLCNRLNGITRPADDDFWNSFTPPNHWRCRSIIKGGDTISEIPDNLEKPAKIFDFNPAKSSSVFSPAHPYFENLPDDVKNDILKDFEKENA